MNKSVTILDLVEVSGISKSTISRYLRGDSVSKKKAEIIEKAIAESGYIRNNYAQLLRTSKSNFIGVLVPDLDNPFFVSIIKRLDQLAYEDHKTLIIKTTMSQYDRELEALDFIRGFRVEGIFLCRSELTDEKIEDLNFSIPVVSIDKEFKNLISVVTNNYRNGYIIAEHMFTHAKGDVMFFSRKHESMSVHKRISGYESYCKEHHHQSFSYTYDRSEGLDFEDLKHFVESNHIDAIIARNDNEAIKIQSYFNDLKYKNKFRSVRVAGFDNIRLSKSILPQLTTIDQEIEEMCDLAYEKFKHYDEIEKKVYMQDSKLIIRASSIEEN